MERKESLKKKVALTTDTILPRMSKSAIALYLLAILIGILLSIYPLLEI